VTYSVVFSKSAKRQINKLSEDDRNRVKERIKEPSELGVSVRSRIDEANCNLIAQCLSLQRASKR
jgi:mRNA-degrading endonuclease RelE of RelBE toxin-antitoxin system